LGLQVHYAQASLALVGPEAVVATEGAFTIVSILPEAIVRVARVGSNNQLRIHAGPLLEVWDLIDLDARFRLGAHGSVSLDVPLGSRFSGVSQAGLAVSASPYKEGELDVGSGAPSFEPRTLWRRSFALGLRYQL
jgi:hypothetical protein